MRSKIALLMILFIATINASAIMPDMKIIMIGGGGRIIRNVKNINEATKKEVTYRKEKFIKKYQ
jgi:hypothetical protein